MRLLQLSTALLLFRPSSNDVVFFSVHIHFPFFFFFFFFFKNGYNIIFIYFWPCEKYLFKKLEKVMMFLFIKLHNSVVLKNGFFFFFFLCENKLNFRLFRGFRINFG